MCIVGGVVGSFYYPPLLVTVNSLISSSPHALYSLGTATTAGVQAVASTGTIAGSIAEGVTYGVAYSSVSTGVTSTVASVASTFTRAAVSSLAAGPLMTSILVGLDTTTTDETWDCWKPVLHETTHHSKEGIALCDCLTDNRIKQVFQTKDDYNNDCYYLVNIWEETFVLSPVYKNDALYAYHATRV